MLAHSHSQFYTQWHMRNLWKHPEDPTRCDAVAPIAETAPVTEAAPVPMVDTRPRVQTGGTRTSGRGLKALARVEANNLETRRLIRSGYTVNNGTHVTKLDTTRCRDLTAVQESWSTYKKSVRNLCCDEFWQFFLPMHTLSGVALSTALGSARKVFLHGRPKLLRAFPPTRRGLMTRMGRLPQFWMHVMHTATIDLSEFNLASGTTSLDFTFIDPIWGWLVAAERQDPLDLHWCPVQQQHSAAPIYGGGVEYGKCFAAACSGVPRGMYPMCVSLHWDGTSAHRGLASTPICIGVANCNNNDVSTQFCIAYIPKLPDDSPEFRKSSIATSVKFSIRQQCISAILRVLEAAAERGVLCNLRNRFGKTVTRALLPRLFAMNLDQPEAQLFFGMLNRTSCSKCIWRKGYSAFRTGTKQDGRAVLRLYNMVRQGGQRARTAAEKLRRWGFNPKRKCCLIGGFEKLLVRLPGGPFEVFPCVDYRDRMHGLIMFIHRAVHETLDGLSKSILSGPSRLILDQRLNYVCQRRCFRDPVTRRSYRVQKSIFSDVGMTASDKACCIFLLPHVLGPKADIVPENVRHPLLSAIAYAQLILIAVRGRRGYTEPELKMIFDEGFKIMFSALQSLLYIDYNTRAANHQSNPAKFKAPTTSKRQTR